MAAIIFSGPIVPVRTASSGTSVASQTASDGVRCSAPLKLRATRGPRRLSHTCAHGLQAASSLMFRIPVLLGARVSPLVDLLHCHRDVGGVLERTRSRRYRHRKRL